MTDTQSSWVNSTYLNGESWVWSVNPECGVRILSVGCESWVWGANPECGVPILSVGCWVFLISLGPGLKLMTITQHSTFKTADSAPCIWMGNLECGRIHIPCSGFPILIHGVLSAECWVSVISLVPGLKERLMTDTHHLTLRIHTPHSELSHSNTWSVECGVLSIRHKSGPGSHTFSPFMVLSRPSSFLQTQIQWDLLIVFTFFPFYDYILKLII